MPRKKRQSKRPEFLSRDVIIRAVRPSVRLHAVHHKGDEPEIDSAPWLELRGMLIEAVKGVLDVTISMFPEEPLVVGTARPASVGSIIQMRPAMSVVVRWPHRDFDRVWSMALAGELTHCHLYFTKPHYNTGLVVSLSVSNRFEE